MKQSEVEKYITESFKKANINLLSSFDSFVNLSNIELESESPVDKGDFKKLWKVLDVKKTQNKMTAKIENDSAYGTAIEYGSKPGSKPWPNPGEKTVMSNGRIYSTQAVGGVINKVFYDEKINMFAEDLANAITKAFK